jgi:uncharacterized membrane protein YfcA
MTRRDRLAVLVLGVAIGAWVGNHAHTPVRQVPVLDGVVLVALVLAALIVLAGPPPPPPPRPPRALR